MRAKHDPTRPAACDTVLSSRVRVTTHVHTPGGLLRKPPLKCTRAAVTKSFGLRAAPRDEVRRIAPASLRGVPTWPSARAPDAGIMDRLPLCVLSRSRVVATGKQVKMATFPLKMLVQLPIFGNLVQFGAILVLVHLFVIDLHCKTCNLLRKIKENLTSHHVLHLEKLRNSNKMLHVQPKYYTSHCV